MTLSAQFNRLKENWIIAVLVALFLIFMNGSDLPVPQFLGKSIDYSNYASNSGTLAERSMYSPIYPSEEGFSPEVKERLVTKNSYLATEAVRGKFHEAVDKIKAIAKASGSFILNEDVNKYESDRKSYLTGNFNIKVETSKYDLALEQIKSIGEIKQFTENKLDVTGRYTNINIEILTEKERLDRFKRLYDEAKDVNDKIALNDKIFELERAIKYLEESRDNIDQRIEYSTITIVITEKRSLFADVEIVKFSKLIKNLVDSFNSLVSLLITLLPWSIVAIIAWIIYKKVK